MKKVILLFFLLCSFFELKAQYSINEGFEGVTFPPSNWSVKSYISGSVQWASSTNQFKTGIASAYANYGPAAGNEVWLVSPRVLIKSGDSLSFWGRKQYNSNFPPDSLIVLISTTDTAKSSFSIFLQYNTNTDITYGTWTYKTAILNAYAGQQVYIAFKHYDQNGNGLWVDDIKAGQPVVDCGVSSVGTTGTYYVAGNDPLVTSGTVKNYGGSTASFTVTRRISPGGYVDTQNITNLPPGGSKSVNFAAWSYTANTAYTIKDSVYIAGDVNHANDTLTGFLTPTTPKNICIINYDYASCDSLIRHMTLAGISSSYYDVLTSLPGIGLSSWKTVFVLLPSGVTWNAALRDYMKAFMDNANDPVNKKSLIIFGNDLGYLNDPKRSVSALPADTLFYRQYLRAVYDADSWLEILGSTKKYKGIISPFTAITADTCTDPFPDAVTPAVWYGGQAALIPTGESGDGDTCNAVVYSGTYYNMFYGTNTYANYVPTTSATLAPQGVIFNMLRAYIESNNGQLPVELAAFSSSVNNRNVTLSWATASEENNAGFNIERKLAGETSWRTLATVNGAGNSNTVKNYSFTDNNLNTGKYNYRLKQVDFNGNFKYYNLSNEVIIGVPNKFALSQNYPNPFNPTTNINYDLPFDSKVQIKVFDITGREVASLVNQVQAAGYYSVNFNASVLSSGVYFYSITADGGNRSFAKTLKMMLVK